MFSCWINFGHPIAIANIFPIIALGSIAVIIAEAAGQMVRKPLPSTNKVQRAAAQYAIPARIRIRI